MPHFEMESGEAWRNGTRGVEIRIGISNSSLVFVRSGSEFVALYEVVGRLFDQETQALRVESTWPERVTVADYAATQITESSIRRYFIEATPDAYDLIVTVRDESSGKTGVRRHEIAIPPLDTGAVSVTALTLEKMGSDGQFHSVIPFRVASDDSLKFVGRINTAGSETRVEMFLLLQRFPTDSLPAAAPYLFSPRLGSLRYSGIDFSKPDSLLIERHQLTSTGGNVTFEFFLPRLSRGVHRIHISVYPAEAFVREKQKPFRLQRNISVLRSGFPRLNTFDELIEPLVYLAKSDEMDSLNAAESQDEKRRQFDAFWLRGIKSQQAASNAVKQYYSRVDEANRFFTGYKEGWKTDRGMIFILFGPPTSISRLMDKESWHYSTTNRTQDNTFVFEKVKVSYNGTLITNYVLIRQSYYDLLWERIVQRWRAGVVF